MMTERERIESFLKSFKLRDTSRYADMIELLIELGKDGSSRSDVKMIQASLDEISRAFRVFSPYRNVRKVCLFGSARTGEAHPNYKLAFDVSQDLTHNGYMVITGAGPGIMEAGNRGADKERSFGLNIELPFEQEPNDYIIDSDKLVSFKYFYLRKLTFIKESDATVLLPGGFGTHDEGFEVLTLVQTGRCAPRPVIMITNPDSDYWECWETYVREHLLVKGYISEEDMSIFKIVHSTKDVVKTIDAFYDYYHSIRYINGLAVIRLNKKLSSRKMKYINTHFKHLLTSGEFRQCGPDAVPEDSAVFLDKERLVFNFNMANFGGVCALIQCLD